MFSNGNKETSRKTGYAMSESSSRNAFTERDEFRFVSGVLVGVLLTELIFFIFVPLLSAVFVSSSIVFWIILLFGAFGAGVIGGFVGTWLNRRKRRTGYFIGTFILFFGLFSAFFVPQESNSPSFVSSHASLMYRLTLPFVQFGGVLAGTEIIRRRIRGRGDSIQKKHP